MILRADHFEARPHEILSDPDLSDEMKRHFKELGLADMASQVELHDIVDECFKCGEMLTTPYIYWHGAGRGLSLHPKCAAALALGLAQDMHEFDTGKRSKDETDAAQWLGAFAQKKLYGVEDDWQNPPA